MTISFLAYGNSAKELRLEKILQKSQQYKLNFFAANKNQSFIIMNNTFKEVPKRFYYHTDDILIPKEARLPDKETLKKLLHIARLKDYSIFLKNDQYLLFLTPKNTLIRINEADYLKYFGPITEEEIVQEENMAIEVKKKLLEKRQRELSGEVREITGLYPGWHYFRLGISLKKVSAESSTTMTNHFAISPYYLFKSFPLAVGLSLGGNIIRSEEKTFLALDSMLHAFTFYKMENFAPALTFGIGKQTWLSMSSSSMAMEIGASLFFRPFFFIQEAFLKYNQVSRSSPDPKITEIKMGISIHLL